MPSTDQFFKELSSRLALLELTLTPGLVSLYTNAMKNTF